MPSCASCGAPYEMPVYRNTLCPSCEKELKTCRNCMHFMPGFANDCREPVSEPILDKDRANFCDWFKPALSAGSGKRDDGEKLRQSLKRLFGDASDDD